MLRAWSQFFHFTRTPLQIGVLVGSVLALSGCHATYPFSRRPAVESELACRTGHVLGPEACPGETLIPDSLSLEDGVTADEAVTVALWNNAAFLELLSELGVSRAQLFNAGLLPDPQVQMFFPVGPKQFELTAFQSLDALWLRPIRQRAAERDLDQLATRLVQNGLDVIRDVRVAHADLLLAQRQLQLAEETLELRQEIARLAQRRNAAGAISDLEAAAPEIDAIQAEADIARITGDVEAARARLFVLMGLDGMRNDLIAVGEETQLFLVPEAEELVAEAFAVRPDLLAAGLALQAAEARVKLARKQCLTFDGILDMNSRGMEGFEAGPGLRLTIPIFNRNRGNIAIALAQYEMASRRYVTLQNQVRQDVLTARARLLQALATLQIVETKLIPATKNVSELAQKNFEGGGVSYILALQTVGQNLLAQTRQAELGAGVRRALAELERSVGHQIHCPPALDSTPPELPPAPASSLGDLPACRPVSHP
jgi:cobalt-zinc-cadmium efflux system outer membrane protein